VAIVQDVDGGRLKTDEIHALRRLVEAELRREETIFSLREWACSDEGKHQLLSILNELEQLRVELHRRDDVEPASPEILPVEDSC
jgi:hypothetical protein